MSITYHNEDCSYKLPEKRRIARWVRETVAEEGYKTGDIAYIFCSASRHREINIQYLSHDYNTDVITFDYSDLTGTGIVSGDIFIDPSTVALNAEQYGEDRRREILRVVIHGVLHLCGYKDKSDDEQRQMRGKEDHYLAKFQA